MKKNYPTECKNFEEFARVVVNNIPLERIVELHQKLSDLSKEHYKRLETSK